MDKKRVYVRTINKTVSIIKKRTGIKAYHQKNISMNYSEQAEIRLYGGGNYFVEHLKEGHKGWIVWDKGQRGLTMSDCELAYTSFDSPTRIIVINRVSLLQDGTIHPTQKPVKLYTWILSKYAKKGDKILDTHVGSASSLIACHRSGFSAWGFEIDPEYYEKAKQRLDKELAQVTVYDLLQP